jgi:hypothetical protein
VLMTFLETPAMNGGLQGSRGGARGGSRKSRVLKAAAR